MFYWMQVNLGESDADFDSPSKRTIDKRSLQFFTASSISILGIFPPQQQQKFFLHFHKYFSYFDIFILYIWQPSAVKKNVFMLKCELSMRSFFATIYLNVDIR